VKGGKSIKKTRRRITKLFLSSPPALMRILATTALATDHPIKLKRNIIIDDHVDLEGRG